MFRRTPMKAAYFLCTLRWHGALRMHAHFFLSSADSTRSRARCTSRAALSSSAVDGASADLLESAPADLHASALCSFGSSASRSAATASDVVRGVCTDSRVASTPLRVRGTENSAESMEDDVCLRWAGVVGPAWCEV
eukprot:2467373-Pleurochrysis_carterae.AAC.1